MRILLVKKLYKNDFHLIEEFLINNFSSPTHWPYWNEVVSSHFDTLFCYYSIFVNGELKGILPSHLKSDGIVSNEFSGQFHYIPYGGWIFEKDFRPANTNMKIDKFSSLSIFSLPLVNEFNFPFNGEEKSHSTLILDLKQDISEIWEKEIDSKRRNMIRKAQKNEVYVEAFINSGIESFYPIYASSSKLNGLNILSKEFFSSLFYNDQNTKFAILNSMHENKILSNIIVAFDKDYSIYWLGNNTKTVNLGQSELLQWHAIKIMKEHGCKYYDLCFIEKERLPHIYEFKKGFARKEVKVPMANYRPFPRKIINKLSKIFN